MLPIIGFIFLFSFHCASPQPWELRDLPSSVNSINGDYPAQSKLHLFQRTHKKRKNAERKNDFLSVLPSGYIDFSGCDGKDVKLSAYKFHRTKKTWNEAQMSCLSEGGYLSYPECPEEGRKYHNILRRVNDGGAWLGIHDLYDEGEWLTVYDKHVNELEYVKWAEAEPNNYGPEGEDCAALDVDGMWYDKPCDKELYFFCKIDI